MSNLSAFATRIYRTGFAPMDFAEVKDGEVIIEAVRPPEKMAGIILSEAHRDAIPGTMCLVFRVLAVGKLPPHVIQVQPGDIVIPRNATMDPIINEGASILSVRAEHVLVRCLKAEDIEAT